MLREGFDRVKWWSDGVVDGLGDDAADCFRYFVATKSRAIAQRKLRGL
jgi:hypothetical protein